MVKKAFGRFSLESTAIVFGWFSLIICLIYLSFWAMWPLLPMNGDIDNEIHNHTISRAEYFMFEEEIGFLMFSTTTVSISLLWGINMNQRLFLIPWLLVMGILTPFFLGFGGILIILYPFTDNNMGEYIFMFIIVIFGTFVVYIWYIVYSLYQKMTIAEKDAREKRLPRTVELEETPYRQLD